VVYTLTVPKAAALNLEEYLDTQTQWKVAFPGCCLMNLVVGLNNLLLHFQPIDYCIG
jgi:hypothetical protein